MFMMDLPFNLEGRSAFGTPLGFLAAAQVVAALDALAGLVTFDLSVEGLGCPDHDDQSAEQRYSDSNRQRAGDIVRHATGVAIDGGDCLCPIAARVIGQHISRGHVGRCVFGNVACIGGGSQLGVALNRDRERSGGGCRSRRRIRTGA